MCGIAGIYFFQPQSSSSLKHQTKNLESMSAMLTRRGPDETRSYIDEHVLLSFSRLAINDLQHGAQPIIDRDVVCAVNGEIYNHQEIRNSLANKQTYLTTNDCESALRGYLEFGIEVVNQLSGMYAGVIWDKQKQQLYLFRDRLGIKPLYYAEVPGGLIFASELKALIQHPECPNNFDWSAVNRIGLHSQYGVPSYVKEIEHLHGGYYLEINQDRWLLHRYWELQHDKGLSGNGTDYAKFYSARIQKSVKEHLLSDVGIACSLSGGVDSSLIAAITSTQMDDLTCFTLDTTITRASGDLEASKYVSSQLGINLNIINLTLDNLLQSQRFDLQRLEYFIWAMDSPRFDIEWVLKHEIYRYISTCYPEMKVILIGQGADEFAGGYSKRQGKIRSSWKEYLDQEILPFNLRSYSIKNDIDVRFLYDLNRNRGSADNSLYFEAMKNYCWQLQHFNLWHEDRMSSIQSLEARVPFLDHSLIEFLASIPESEHQAQFWNKQIVRDALLEFMPSKLANRDKVAFIASNVQSDAILWTYKILKSIYADFIDKYYSSGDSVFSREQVTARFSSMSDGRKVRLEKVMSLLELVCIEIFCHQLKHRSGMQYMTMDYRNSSLSSEHTAH